MTHSPRPPCRPPKISLDILTSYFNSTLKRKARDGLSFDLTCAQVVNFFCSKIKILLPHFSIITIQINLTHMIIIMNKFIFFFFSFCILVSVLLSAQVDRFSTSRIRDFEWVIMIMIPSLVSLSVYSLASLLWNLPLWGNSERNKIY